MVDEATTRRDMSLLNVILLAQWLFASQASAEEYRIDAANTSVAFEVRVLGHAVERGHFGHVTGTVCLRPQANDGSVDISVDARSLRMNRPALSRLVRGDGFLDVQQYATISYRASQVVFADGALARIDGELTLRGVTKAIPLNVTAYRCTTRADRDDCTLSAAATLSRAQFGMTGYRALVSDRTRLTIRAEGISIDRGEPAAQGGAACDRSPPRMEAGS